MLALPCIRQLGSAGIKSQLIEKLGLTQALAQQVFVFLKKMARNAFIEEALFTFTKSLEGGIRLKLKGDAIERVFVPVVTQLVVDNLQAYECLGLQMRGGNVDSRNCRFCLKKSGDFYDNLEDAQYLPDRILKRGSSESAFLASHLLDKLLREVGYRAELGRLRATRKVDSNDEDARLCKRAKLQNIQPMGDSMRKIFKFMLDAGVINSVHEALPPDKLHSFDKGAVEYSIRWTISIVYLWWKNVKRPRREERGAQSGAMPKKGASSKTMIAILNSNGKKEVVRSPIALLDDRLKEFPRWTAINPLGDGTRTAHLRDGISVLFTDTENSKGAIARGVITGGGLDAKKMGQYVLQLLIAIGTEGDVIPNEVFRFKAAKGMNNGVNPTRVIMTALGRIFELQLLLHGETFLHSDIAYIDHLLKGTTVALKDLWDLKQLLGGFPQRLTVVKIETFAHSTGYISALGAPKNWDTAVLEREHRFSVHLASDGISNRTDDAEDELLKHSLIKRRLELLSAIAVEKEKENEVRTSTCRPEDVPKRAPPLKRKGVAVLRWDAARAIKTPSANKVTKGCWYTPNSEVPLHPLLLGSDTAHQQSLLMYVDHYLRELCEKQRQFGDGGGRLDEKLQEAKKERGKYRLVMLPSYRFNLSDITKETEELEEDEDDVDEKEQETSSTQDSSKQFDSVAFTLHATNNAQTRAGNARRRQFDFVEAIWDDEGNPKVSGTDKIREQEWMSLFH